MNFIQSFNYFFDFFFPTEKINTNKIKALLNNRVLFYPLKFTIHFLPYRNIFVNQAITSLKFRNNKKIAYFFGEILYENLPGILIDLEISDNFNKPLLITIPISKKRKQKRGYNQTDLIIKNFLKLGGNEFCQYENNVLIKIKNTKPQTKIKTKTERKLNPLGGFEIKNKEKIKNRNIILFDDVYTTGSTTAEAKRILKQAQAKKILIVTIAR